MCGLHMDIHRIGSCPTTVGRQVKPEHVRRTESATAETLGRNGGRDICCDSVVHRKTPLTIGRIHEGGISS